MVHGGEPRGDDRSSLTVWSGWLDDPVARVEKVSKKSGVRISGEDERVVKFDENRAMIRTFDLRADVSGLDPGEQALGDQDCLVEHNGLGGLVSEVQRRSRLTVVQTSAVVGWARASLDVPACVTQAPGSNKIHVGYNDLKILLRSAKNTHRYTSPFGQGELFE